MTSERVGITQQQTAAPLPGTRASSIKICPKKKFPTRHRMSSAESTSALSSSCSSRHPTWSMPYMERAYLPQTPQLKSYLFRLMATKKTNLCLSADVHSTSELLEVAEECGDSICVLKTHADTVSDFGERTMKGLTEIAERKKFLIFEDRKFGDIGKTVQAQYVGRPYRIASWASITNAHAFPGPAIITSLKEAAVDAVSAYNTRISTEITGGGGWSDGYFGASAIHTHLGAGGDSSPTGPATGGGGGGGLGGALDIPERPQELDVRKASVVSISTTISTEYDSPPAQQPPRSYPTTPLDRLPLDRGLLILAQMSSVDNLMTPGYTDKCIEMARQDPDFVIGFVAQQSLNRAEADNFLVMTPGVSLPPSAAMAKAKGQAADASASTNSTSSRQGSSTTAAPPPPRRRRISRASQSSDSSTSSSSTVSTASSGGTELPGDGLGQQYNTPRKVILTKGVDVIIVGRGILNASDRAAEAERYRREGWKAYLERTHRDNN